jgi:hypothetical protein
VKHSCIIMFIIHQTENSARCFAEARILVIRPTLQFTWRNSDTEHLNRVSMCQSTEFNRSSVDERVGPSWGNSNPHGDGEGFHLWTASTYAGHVDRLPAVKF